MRNVICHRTVIYVILCRANVYACIHVIIPFPPIGLNELHVKWCNDKQVTSNPLYSHATWIAWCGLSGTHEISPSASLATAGGHSPSSRFWKRGLRNRLCVGHHISRNCRHEMPSRNRAINSELPGRHNSATYTIWHFLPNEINGFRYVTPPALTDKTLY